MGVLSYQPIPGGDAGTRRTVAAMVKLIRWGAWQPSVRQVALRTVGTLDGRDGYAQAVRIREWLAGAFHFIRDPMNIELLHSPAFALSNARPDGTIYGDCDDAAILGASVAQAIGLQARLMVVGFLSPKAPFRHVWAEIAAPVGVDKDRWVELDVTRQSQSIPYDKISRTWVVPVVERSNTIIGLLALGAMIACMDLKGSTFSIR